MTSDGGGGINYPPVARIIISPDTTVDELTTVTLHGTTSTDHETDTNNLDYIWEITSNSIIDPVTLSSTVYRHVDVIIILCSSTKCHRVWFLIKAY